MPAKSTAGSSTKASKAKPKSTARAGTGAAKTKRVAPKKVAAKAAKTTKAAPAKATKAAPAKAAKGATPTGAKATKKTRPAKSRKSAGARTDSKATRAPASEPAPLERVRPLIRVRQMRGFTGKRVTQAELDAITEVARWSGSSRNEQPCRFIALRDRETIARIAELGMPQTRGLPSATAAIAICVPNEPEREISRAFDDGRAAERILVAANLLGLGAGVSRVRRDVRGGIDKALGLPANRSVRTIVAIGHPTPEALEPKSRPGHARLPREEVIYPEHWPEAPKDS